MTSSENQQSLQRQRFKKIAAESNGQNAKGYLAVQGALKQGYCSTGLPTSPLPHIRLSYVVPKVAVEGKGVATGREIRQ